MQRNPYGFSVDSALPIGEAETRVRQLLEEEGFEILPRIDVRKILKAKLGIEFREYRILGAFDPSITPRTLQLEPSIGLVLPFNVVLEGKPVRGTRVSFLDPVVVMAMVGNPALREIAAEASIRLMRVARLLPRRPRSDPAYAAGSVLHNQTA